MTFPTFAPGVNPSYNYTKEIRTRTLKADFGEGYSQRAGDGLNAVTRHPTLTFGAISTSIADDIEEFMLAQAGYQPFYYTLPDEASPRKFICENWPRRPLGPDIWEISLELTEVFDIDF